MAVCDNGNGIKTRLEIERRDLFKVGGFVLILLTVVTGAAMFVFQTRARAIEEHAAIEQTAALHAQEMRLRREYEEKETTEIQKAVDDTKKIVLTLDANQRGLMAARGIRKSKIEPLPAGIDFGDLDSGEPGPPDTHE